MHWTSDDIVRALQETTKHRQFVSIGRRKHYIRVYGPSTEPVAGKPHVVVERYNGTVAFNRDAVAQQIVGIQRRTSPPLIHIHHDPIGASAGDYGNFEWAISIEDARTHYGTLDAFIDAIVTAFNQSGIGW